MDDNLKRAIAEMMMRSNVGAGQFVPHQDEALQSFFPNARLGMESVDQGRPQMRGGLSMPFGGNDVGISGAYKPNIGATPEWSTMGRLTRQF